MTFSEAKAVTIPFPKSDHFGKTLDKIAETDKGLRYLDWLRGQKWTYGRLKVAIDTYLSDSAIVADLTKLQE